MNMDIWLQLLLDPAAVTDHESTVSSEQLGLALLLQGDFLQYSRRSSQLGLPGLSEPTVHASGDRALLVAMVSAFRGEPNARLRFSRLLKSWKRIDARRALAGILASMHFADTGDLAAAIEALSDLAMDDPAWSSAVQLHRGLRLVEMGDWESGLDATIRAQRFADDTDPSDQSHDILSWATGLNAVHFNWLLGRFVQPGLPLRQPASFDSVDVKLQNALASYFTANYSAAFRNLDARSFTFQSQDPISSQLDAALIRAECLAEWQTLQEARTTAGRWRLLNGLGGAGAPADSGFELLRQARDSEGLDQALSYARKVGALPVLRAIGSREVVRPWSRTTRRATISILSGSSDELTAELSDQCISRMITEWAFLTTPTAFEHVGHAAIDTLSSLLVSASPSQHEEVARLFAQWTREPRHALDLHAIGRGLHSVDWTFTSKTTRATWKRLCKANLGERTDLSQVAFEAALECSSLDPNGWAELIAERFRETHDSAVGTLLLRITDAVSEDILAEMTDQASQDVRRLLESARGHSYGFGQRISSPLLLADLYFRRRTQDVWGLLTTFLFEPAVAVHDKAPFVDFLAQSASRLNDQERAELSANEALLKTGFLEPLGGSQEDLDGASLRLRLGMGAVDYSELIGTLTEWSTSESATLRLQSARSMLFVPDSFADQSAGDVLTILLQALVRDREYSVSAQALYALAVNEWTTSEAVEKATDQLLRMMLTQGDSRRPWAVLTGLKRRLEREPYLPHALLADVKALRNEHVSATVRKVSAELLLMLGPASA